MKVLTLATLTLREGEPAQLVRLPQAVAEALSQSEAVTVSLVPEAQDRDVWSIAAAGKVGAVRVGGLEVIVQPKVDINRLVFMMGYTRNPNFWRDDLVDLDSAMSLPEALAHAFAKLATRALEQGLLKGYLTVDDTTSVLRGRIREADQIRRRFGRGIPLEVRYDDFTVDIAENRLLLAAAHRLLRMPTLRRGVRNRVQRLRLQLADVALLTRGAVRPSWTASRLNARYVPALRLADLILDGHSFEHGAGELTVTGFLFNMWKIYEDFVCVAMREALRPYGGRSSLQYSAFLDDAEAVPIQPDFVWSMGGQPRLVMDAKYKAEKPAGFPQADIYQVLAYCTRLGLAEGHLVYAKGEEAPTVHRIVGSDVSVHCHALDLDQSPSALLAQIGAMAERLAGAGQGRLQNSDWPVSQALDTRSSPSLSLADRGAVPH